MWLSGYIGYNAISANNPYSIRHYEIILDFCKIGLELSVMLLMLTMMNSWQPEKSWIVTRYLCHALYTLVRCLIFMFFVMGFGYADVRPFVQRIIKFPSDAFNPELNEKPNFAGLVNDWIVSYCYVNAGICFAALALSYSLMAGIPLLVLMNLLQRPIEFVKSVGMFFYDYFAGNLMFQMGIELEVSKLEKERDEKLAKQKKK